MTDVLGRERGREREHCDNNNSLLFFFLLLVIIFCSDDLFGGFLR